MLAASAVTNLLTAPPRVSDRIRARYYTATPYGAPYSTLVPGYPTLPSPRRDARLYVTISGAVPGDTSALIVEPLPVDSASDRLTVAWMQFEAGSSAARALDPSEWNDPQRACTACRTDSGDAAVMPSDAIATPGGR